MDCTNTTGHALCKDWKSQCNNDWREDCHNISQDLWPHLDISLKELLTMLGLFSLSTVQIRFIKMEMQIHDHQGSLNKEVS